MYIRQRSGQSDFPQATRSEFRPSGVRNLRAIKKHFGKYFPFPVIIKSIKNFRNIFLTRGVDVNQTQSYEGLTQEYFVNNASIFRLLSVIIKEKGGVSMGFWKQVFRPRVPVAVLSGGHVLTDKVEGKGLVNRISVMKGRKSGEVEIATMFGQKHFTFSRISWEPSGSRSVGKAAGGAIAGAIIAGPLGGIAGAAIGAKKKDNSTAYVYLIDEEGIEHEVHIKCTKEQYTQISRIAF